MVRVPLPDPLNDEPLAVTVMLLLFAELSHVPVKAPMVIDCTVIVPPKLSVTVPPPDEPSKVTVSDEPGTDCPPAPPDDDAQCVVSLLSQVPVPPTQNLAEIRHLPARSALFLKSLVTHRER